MTTIAFWLSLAILALLVAQGVALQRGLRVLRRLEAIAPDAAATLPSVSIVVSALDEADTIEPAIRSLLALEHPRLEVIAIDDRSRDATGAILNRVASEDPRLRVLHVAALPDGWLGKTHALHAGAQAATGEWLLFTDADVHFAPDTLARTLAHCRVDGIDHLAVVPHLHVGERLLAALLLDAQVLFYAVFPPWKLRGSPNVYVGIGAFNLVRRAAYERSGGHEALRLEVLDDLGLGRNLKHSGARQDLVLGGDRVALEWYADAAAMARGLEKNSFAAAGYSVVRALAGTIALLAVRTWPWIALALTSGATWWINLAAITAALWVHVQVLRTTPWRAGCLLWFPFSPLVTVAIPWRAVAITLAQGGIRWRGTFYPLAALRRFRRATWR